MLQLLFLFFVSFYIKKGIVDRKRLSRNSAMDEEEEEHRSSVTSGSTVTSTSTVSSSGMRIMSSRSVTRTTKSFSSSLNVREEMASASFDEESTRKDGFERIGLFKQVSEDVTGRSVMRQDSSSRFLLKQSSETDSRSRSEESRARISPSRAFDRSPLLNKTCSDDDKMFLSAESNQASKSMESLQHRSFLTSSEKEVRRITSAESLEKVSRFRRTVSGEEEFSRQRRICVPSHLSLAPPGFGERKLTILSPGWAQADKKFCSKKPTLPKLILPTPDQSCWPG